MKKLLLTTTLALASLQSASAITFDLYNAQGNIASGVFTYTVSGVTLTGMAYQGLTPTPINLVTGASVQRNNSSPGGAGGLGVNGTNDSDDQIDLSDTSLGEGLVLSFSGPAFKLESVTFSNVNPGDDLNFAIGSGSNPTGSYLLNAVDLNALAGSNSNRTWNVSGSNYVGTNFLFASIQSPGETSEDSFRIASITVSAVSTPSVPDGGSTAALLGLCLVGLASVRRLRKS